MSYRLRDPVPLQREVRRVAREQVDAALEGLSRPAVPEGGVHEARRRLKRLRALLRLLRSPLGDVYKRENQRFRDVGRALADVRDAQVVRETFEQLFHEPRSRDVIALRERLGLEQARAMTGKGPLERRLPPLRKKLIDGRRQIDRWPLERSTGFESLEPGLARSYRRARLGLERAGDRGTPEDFHEWRKRVKYHREHIRLLQDAWTGPLKARRRSLGRLSDLLGEAHDLSVLRQWLEEAGTRQRAALSPLDQRRHELEKQALPLGRRLFVDKPAQLARRLRACWQAWAEERATREQSERRSA